MIQYQKRFSHEKIALDQNLSKLSVRFLDHRELFFMKTKGLTLSKMNPTEILSPKIKIISTKNSSSTTDYMILFDATKHSDDYFSDDDIDKLVELIWDDKLDDSIFILHETSSERAYPIEPLEKIDLNQTSFKHNEISLDDMITRMLVAAKSLEEVLLLKSGTYSWIAGKDYSGPSSWEEMNEMTLNQYGFVSVAKEKFWKIYLSALKKW